MFSSVVRAAGFAAYDCYLSFLSQGLRFSVIRIPGYVNIVCKVLCAGVLKIALYGHSFLSAAAKEKIQDVFVILPGPDFLYSEPACLMVIDSCLAGNLLIYKVQKN